MPPLSFITSRARAGPSHPYLLATGNDERSCLFVHVCLVFHVLRAGYIVEFWGLKEFFPVPFLDRATSIPSHFNDRSGIRIKMCFDFGFPTRYPEFPGSTRILPVASCGRALYENSQPLRAPRPSVRCTWCTNNGINFWGCFTEWAETIKNVLKIVCSKS